MGYGTSQSSSHAHHLRIVIFCLLVGATDAVRYVWKTGLWMECRHHGCGPGGTRFRSVFCGEDGEYNYSEVSATKCNHLSKPKTMEDCFKVCEKHQLELRWAASVWSDCKLDPAFHDCSIRNGIRTRNVTCVWRKNGHIEGDSICSEFQTKPSTRDKCKLKCPQDCVVTYFSDWKNCDNCMLLNRTRTRQLVVPPANGGRLCPNFTDMVPCDNCSETFTFQIGPWNPCSPAQFHRQAHPRIGFQKRSIFCLNHYGSNVGYKNCIDNPQASSSLLTDKQTCIIPQDCLVSDWQEMQEVNSSCLREDGSRRPGFMVRERKVLQIPLGTGQPCPILQHFFEVQATNEKLCQRPNIAGGTTKSVVNYMTHWQTSSWSDCEAPPRGFGCTAGLQTRKVFCIHETEDGMEKPVAEQQCDVGRRPVTSQICAAECTQDCTVSHWTQWSECKVTDCELYARRRRTDEGTGQRYRTRTVLTEASGDGRPCVHLSETQMCDPQPCYHWNMTVGKCHLLDLNTSPPCGLGKAHRTLACVSKIGHRVSDKKCEEVSKPPTAREDCDVPCPDDCIVSPWGEWSQCPNLCHDGRSRPALRSRRRTILAQAGRNGKACPMTHHLLENMPCPTTIECAIYAWQVGRWGTCAVQDCGMGIQTRDVNCYTILQRQLVSDQRCTLALKPIFSRECLVPCPVDCEVTSYSDWSECSSTCWDSRQTVPVKTRIRHVIQHAQHGGTPCPKKLTDFKHCTNLTLCEGQYWDTGPWSRCIIPPDKECGQGLRARDVTCRSDNGTGLQVDECIRNIGRIPAIARTCHKSCEEECVFEEWSQWSRCINGCNGNRYRTRKLIEDQHSAPNPRCRDHRLYPLDVFEKCLCDDHQPVPIGNWSECILESDSEYYRTNKVTPLEEYVSMTQGPSEGEVAPGNAVEGMPTHKEVALSRQSRPGLGIYAVCGQGRRYKVLACQNDRGEVEAANQCSLKPYQKEVCVIPCPVDCVMSEWSQWTDCTTSCGTGTQLRYRHKKQDPSNGGRQCPSLDNASKETQNRVCITDCRRYKWHVFNWSPCMPDHLDDVCGKGTQSRTVRCEVFMSTGFTDESVGDSYCPYPRPHVQQQCYAPCVGECVVSVWSEWDRCTQPCSDPNQVESRTRVVLRQPLMNPRNNCPSLLEEQFCVRGDNCMEYTWLMSDWTSCLVNNGLDDCGTGHRERHPICRDQNGRLVDNQNCVQALGENQEEMVVSCKVPCDVDCLLTEWSPWSECSNDCGIGARSRTRSVVQQPIGNGRLCNTSYEQTKPCFQQGCYTWHVSDWSPCTSRTGVCGHGVETRNISCVTSGGLIVNVSNCAPDMTIIILQTERPCTKACPGECVLTHWSEWNDCFIDCKDYLPGRYTRGVKSRSRAVLAYAQMANDPCPDQLWESEPCEAKHCFIFRWKASDWSTHRTRHVWCERSDGLLVEGGCSEQARPETSLRCKPSCSVKNSYCNDTNFCACPNGHGSVFNSLDVLIDCKKMANETTDANLKTVTLPEDGATNIWMYAVIAAGTLFVIFLAVACYTMSEFFHKGPRPRKKDEEKSVEGADGVDGMPVAETAFVSCNHVTGSPDVPGAGATASTAVTSDVDRISVISADRTPPASVRAFACGVKKVENIKHVNTSMPTTPHGENGRSTIASDFGMLPGERNKNNNDFSQTSGFCQNCDNPDCGGQHFRSFLHENDDLYDDGAGDVDTLHAHAAYSESKCRLHATSTRCGTCDNNNSNVINDPSVSSSTNTLTKAEISPSNKKTNFPKPKSSSTLDSRAKPLYSRVNKTNQVETKVLKDSGRFTDAGRASKDFGNGNRFQPGVMGIDSESVSYVRPNSETISSIANCSMDTTDHEYDDSGHQDHTGIVYLNREASVSEAEQSHEVEDIKSTSLKNILKTYLNQIDQLATGADGGPDADSATARDESNVDDENDTVFGDESLEQREKVPLLKDRSKIEHRKVSRPPLVHTKSQSVDLPLSVHRNVSNISHVYDSDDSGGRNQSMRSQRSMTSRISNLSINRGPSVEIEPEERIVPDYTQTSVMKTRHPGDTSSLPAYPNSRSASGLPKKRMNIGYITFSSVDTETSTPPSSSVSSDSLSPRSLPVDLEDYPVDPGQYYDKTKGNTLERSFRNVAMDSIKQQRAPPAEAELDVDSGLGLNIESDRAGVHGSGGPPIKVRKSTKRNGASSTGRAQGRKAGGVNGHSQKAKADGSSTTLLTPMHFVGPNGETKRKSPNGLTRKNQADV